MADITMLPNEVIRYIVKEFLCAEDEDQFGLVCKQWKQLRDEDLWTGQKLATFHDPITHRLSKRPFRFFGVRTTGTEGICCKVQFRPNRKLFAMKKARVYPRGEGVPYYMLREIEFLRTATHPNISSLCAVSLRGSELMMFFPYCPRTLHEALNPPNERNESGMPLPLHITKRFLYQILQGLTYCHDRGVLHRNLKPKHLLLCDTTNSTSCLFPKAQNWERDVKQMETIPVQDLEHCQVLISDFALVRTSLLPLRRFTPEVVTLWYRAPEILLAGHYFTSIDVWSVGCVFAEMLTGKPFFAGVCEVNQLFEIFSRVGTPNEETWPGFSSLPNISIEFPNWPQIGLKRFFPDLPADGLHLLESMLQLNPAKRIHARDALQHPFFQEFYGTSTKKPENGVEEKLGLANPTLLQRYLPNMVQIERDSFALSEPGPFPMQRLRACQRIIEINDMFEMSMRTEFLAINLLDRFLAKLPVGTPAQPTVWPLLLDITCLHMASKCEDVSYIGVGDLIQLPAPLDNEAGDIVEREKLSQMLLKLQEDVLAALEFRLQVPTVLDFLFSFCFKLGVPAPSAAAAAAAAAAHQHDPAAAAAPPPADMPLSPWFDSMCYFAELSLLNHTLATYKPSHIAFAIVVHTHFAFKEQMQRDKFLELYELVQIDFNVLGRILALVRESTTQEVDTMHRILYKRYRAGDRVSPSVAKPSTFDLLTTHLLDYRDWVNNAKSE